jgi:hypothetical protein
MFVVGDLSPENGVQRITLSTTNIATKRIGRHVGGST